MTDKEFLDEYGGYVVKFLSYYKYTFYFSANPDGDKSLVVGVGGNSDDIYKLEVSVDGLYTIESLEPNYVLFKDGETELYSYNDC